MNLKELLDNNKIERVEKGVVDFDIVDADLVVANNNFVNGDYNWALSICYHAVLRCGIGFMNFLGYRAIGREHHKNVFSFLGTFVEFEELAKYFDRIRKKRNKFVYVGEDSISEDEANEVLVKAKKFVSDIRTFVLENRTERGADGKY